MMTGTKPSRRTATTTTTCALAELGRERAGKPVDCATVGTETTGREDSTDMVVSGLGAKMWRKVWRCRTGAETARSEAPTAEARA